MLVQELLCITGSLEAGSSSIPPDQKSVFRDALQMHNLQYEVLSGEEVNQRFPGYNLPPDFQARIIS